MQPIALVSGQIDRPWEEALPLIQHARDWHFENAAFYAILPEHLRATIHRAPLTDAAAYHLWLHTPPRRLFQRVHLHSDRLITPTLDGHAPNA